MDTYLGHGQRLEKIIEYYNINQSEMARRIGYKQSNINAIIRGREDGMSANMMVAICESFRDINGDWLLTGKGAMLKSDVEKKYSMPVSALERVSEPQAAGYTAAELSPVAMLGRIEALERRVGMIEDRKKVEPGP